MWQDTEIQPISHAALLALVENRIPAVRIADFASREEAGQLATALAERACRTNSIKQVTRLGISQYQQGLRVSKSNYFTLARQLDAEFSRIYSSSFSPVQRLINQLDGLGFDVAVMSEPGFGHYFAGNGKLRNGSSPIHVDYAPQDSAGWAIAQARAQLAWNVYLDIPEQGGELLLWDKQWEPQDDEFQTDDSYFYQDEVVRGAQMLRLKVYPGEVIIINSRNFHAVAEAEDRLAFGSFIGVFEHNLLRFWS